MCLLESNLGSRLTVMRWDNLRLDSTGSDDGLDAPPLIERNAVVRTFDTPGFRDMTFYEIHAKSIVSRVPEASKVPFRYTINPYRGCQHSGDHRFLTERGWKHVTGAEQGPDQRPFLTTNNKLMGFGGFPEPPKE